MSDLGSRRDPENGLYQRDSADSANFSLGAIWLGPSGLGSPVSEKNGKLRLPCYVSVVPFFFKQWGGSNKKKTGRLLEGRTRDEMPAIGSSSGPCNLRSWRAKEKGPSV